MSLPANKTTFVFLKSTRQVLATTTRLALPPAAVPTGSETDEQRAANAAAELKRLVGNQLRVRDLQVEPVAATFDVIASGIVFPATELDVVTGDFKPTVFADPRKYYINEENEAKAGLDPSSLKITIEATKVTVEPTTITQDSQVRGWVFYDDKSKDPVPLDGVLKKDVTPLKVEIPVALTTGKSYHAVVLVQNFRPTIHPQTI